MLAVRTVSTILTEHAQVQKRLGAAAKAFPQAAEDVSASLARLLRLEGHETEIAHDGAEAVEMSLARGTDPESGRRVFVQRSADDGATWSPAEEPDWWNGTIEPGE